MVSCLQPPSETPLHVSLPPAPTFLKEPWVFRRVTMTKSGTQTMEERAKTQPME